jgi:hypothetical protein
LNKDNEEITLKEISEEEARPRARFDKSLLGEEVYDGDRDATLYDDQLGADDDEDPYMDSDNDEEYYGKELDFDGEDSLDF